MLLKEVIASNNKEDILKYIKEQINILNKNNCDICFDIKFKNIKTNLNLCFEGTIIGVKEEIFNINFYKNNTIFLIQNKLGLLNEKKFENIYNQEDQILNIFNFFNKNDKSIERSIKNTISLSILLDNLEEILINNNNCFSIKDEKNNIIIDVSKENLNFSYFFSKKM